MKKRIKKYGNSAIINFTKEDLETEGWQIGDIINLSDAFKVLEKKKRGKKNG